MSKHEEIIRYIGNLEIGTKISVRSIASELNVSDGTAYRAIKDAEVLGIANTIPRVGTVRVEKLEKKHIDKLTYEEIVNIVEGSVLGGKEGLFKTLNKFVIGAMTMDSMKKYISPGNLLIVGDREEAQRIALENECAVLVTGGLECSEEIKDLADTVKLPVISCAYDTFTTASMINKAISENLIKKDIILVEDIMRTEIDSIQAQDTIENLRDTVRKTKHGKFPVVDEGNKLVGMMTFKDLASDEYEEETISKVMVREPVTIDPKASVAFAAHIMAWEGIELIPVTEGKKLVGVISRHDVIKALQHVNRQPQVGETIDDLALSNFTYTNTEGGVRFTGKIVPQLLSHMGTASWSALNLLMSNAGIVALKQKNNINVALDSFTVFFARPIQLDAIVNIDVNIIHMGRDYSKVEIDMIGEESRELIGKAFLSAKVFRK